MEAEARNSTPPVAGAAWLTPVPGPRTVHSSVNCGPCGTGAALAAREAPRQIPTSTHFAVERIAQPLEPGRKSVACGSVRRIGRGSEGALATSDGGARTLPVEASA